MFRKIYIALKGRKTPTRLYFEESLWRQRRHVKGLVLNVGGGTQTYRGLNQRMISVDRSAEADADVVCDLMDGGLPFRTGAFHSVICTSVLEHVVSPREVTEEIARVLAEGGMLIYFTPFLYRYHADPHDYWRFTKVSNVHLICSIS